jgi:hypothetical protein
MLETYRALFKQNEFYGALAALASAAELGKDIESELVNFNCLSVLQLSQICKTFNDDVARASFLLDYSGKLEDEEVMLICSLRQGARLVAKLVGAQLPDELISKLDALDEKMKVQRSDPAFSRQLNRCNAFIVKNAGFDV